MVARFSLSFWEVAADSKFPPLETVPDGFCVDFDLFAPPKSASQKLLRICESFAEPVGALNSGATTVITWVLQPAHDIEISCHFSGVSLGRGCLKSS